MRRRIIIGVGAAAALVVLAGAAWAWAIGPTAVWRVLSHGTTTVWDHQSYPGRSLSPSPEPFVWPERAEATPEVMFEGSSTPINQVLEDHAGLALVVVRDGAITHEWYAADHAPETASMLFSVSKSITSLLIGTAIEDGLIRSVSDRVTDHVPELADRGFAEVTLEDLLRMDSNSTYVEDDNPFGVHVEFNYTADLESDILTLRVREEPHSEFTYKSGDNALLGLVLGRALTPESITEYAERRILHRLGNQSEGIWSTDDTDGLERTWCCLALTARDLALIGQAIVDGGADVIPQDWLDASFEPAYPTDAWPADYGGTRLANYGYQWWLLDDGAVVALGKEGQYLYVDRARATVVVRTGTSQGGIGWLDLLAEIAAGS